MKYETRIESLSVGSGDCQVNLEIEVIADFNRAIDDMFAELQTRGQQDLLVDLCPYFGTVWDSSRVLAGFLADNHIRTCQGKRLLEIGCGLAIPSLVALKLGAQQVTATDLHPDVEHFLEQNLRRNGIALTLTDHPDFSYRRVDWRNPTHGLLDGGIEIVLGSDILYDRGQPSAVAAFLSRCFGAGAKAAILTDPGRPYLQEFVTECERSGLHAKVDIIRLDPLDPRRDVFLMEITSSR